MDRQKLKELIKNKKNIIVIAVGVIGVFLLFISEFSLPEEKNKKEDTALSSTASLKKDTENELEKLISSIDGAGKTTVMLTYASEGEQAFATDKSFQQSQSERSTEISGDEKYVLIDSGTGDGGLKIKTFMPEINGVAVVCEGGGDSYVKREITEAVSAVLGIGRERIYVAKMNTDKNNGG